MKRLTSGLTNILTGAIALTGLTGCVVYTERPSDGDSSDYYYDGSGSSSGGSSGGSSNGGSSGGDFGGSSSSGGGFNSDDNPLDLTPVNPTPSTTEEVSFFASEDSYVDDSQPYANFGSNQNLLTGEGSLGTYTAFMKFNLSSIPPRADVRQARLEIATGKNNTFRKPVGTMTVSEVSQFQGWSESGLTYISSPDSSSWISSREVTLDEGNTYHFDVTSTVQGWVDGETNNGFMIRTRGLDVVSSAGLYSSESSGRESVLRITYEK